jgi:hypothetical protein
LVDHGLSLSPLFFKKRGSFSILAGFLWEQILDIRFQSLPLQSFILAKLIFDIVDHS